MYDTYDNSENGTPAYKAAPPGCGTGQSQVLTQSPSVSKEQPLQAQRTQQAIHNSTTCNHGACNDVHAKNRNGFAEQPAGRATVEVTRVAILKWQTQHLPAVEWL